jgi:2-methylcitrate dehydratase PrpD
VSETVGELARRRVFDTLGPLAAGRAVAASRCLPALGGASAADEVRDLCATARCSEVDDIDVRSCTTPGAVVVPVALVVAAAHGCDGTSVLDAVAAGYEAMVGAGEAIDGPRRLATGVWPTYYGAPLAAAATAARLLELDDERTAHALAIAASRAVGTAGRIAGEPTSRWLTCGCAAADGVVAALAAQAGMLGDLALSGARPPAAPEPAVARVEVKPFPGARQAQPAVQAALAARDELGAAPVAIDIAVPEAYRAMVDQPAPTARLASLASAQFQVAAALTEPDALFDITRDRPALGPRGQALMAATRVSSDDELTGRYPLQWGARVRLRDERGATAQATVLEPDGQPSWDDLVAKHVRLGAWDADDAARARAACTAAELDPRELLDLARHREPQEVGR